MRETKTLSKGMHGGGRSILSMGSASVGVSVSPGDGVGAHGGVARPSSVSFRHKPKAKGSKVGGWVGG